MKRIYKEIIYIVTITLLYSCGYDCPGYDLSDKSIIPFRLNDTLFYTSNNNDTIQLIVTQFDFEKATKVNGFYTTFECNDGAYYSTLVENELLIKEDSRSSGIKVEFYDSKAYKLLYKSETRNEDLYVQYSNNKEIDEKIYQAVWEVKDLSGQRRIDKFIEVAYYGIITFHDKNTDITWTLATSRLPQQSLYPMQTYLEDDLRIDFSVVEHCDMKIVRQCIEARKKKRCWKSICPNCDFDMIDVINRKIF